LGVADLAADRIRNISQASELIGGAPKNRYTYDVEDVFPRVEIEPPTYTGGLRLNYDYSDFIPVKKDV